MTITNEQTHLRKILDSALTCIKKKKKKNTTYKQFRARDYQRRKGLTFRLPSGSPSKMSVPALYTTNSGSNICLVTCHKHRKGSNLSQKHDRVTNLIDFFIIRKREREKVIKVNFKSVHGERGEKESNGERQKIDLKEREVVHNLKGKGKTKLRILRHH